MPASDPRGKVAIKSWILEQFNSADPILDVGPGEGTYYNMLKPLGFVNMSAVEIFEPYIRQFDLRAKYIQVINDNILNISDQVFNRFSLMILGDILEHLTFEEAHGLLTRVIKDTRVRGVIVSVPFLYPQGSVYGNAHEAHEQDDLTPEIMGLRYPYLNCLAIDGFIGVYIFLRDYES